MTEIKDAFTAQDGTRRKAFIPFITCDDPTLGFTEDALLAMQEAGADLIELGIPFSDPTAEGPVIQEANIRALSGGVTTDKIFGMVKEVRGRGLTVPVVFMTYANVVFGYGTERFAAKAAETGVQGTSGPMCPSRRRRSSQSRLRKRVSSL